MSALAILVFVTTFLLLAARRLGRMPLARGPVALLGGLIMIAVAPLPPAHALQAIDAGTIALVLGMMLIGATLAAAGFFPVAARLILRSATTERRLVLGTLWASALLSALFLNDTIALLLPPVLFIVLRAAGVPVFRTLAATAIGVSVGSLWTPIGNPQNAYLATVHDIPFTDFFVTMTPLVLFGLLTASLVLAPGASTTHFPAVTDLPAAARRLQLTVALTTLGATLILFVLSSTLGIPLWAIALGAGTLLLLVAPLLDHETTPRDILHRVDGNLLLLFAGLFLLIEGARVAGIVDALFAALPLSATSPHQEIAQITLITLVFSNLFSNVPAVLLLDPAVSVLGNASYPLLLAAASTLAGNTMVLASAATIIIAEQAEAHGETFPFWRFVRVGLPVSLVTLAATVLYFTALAGAAG